MEKPVKKKPTGKKILRADFSGTLEFGGLSLPCYVLEDGRRVFSIRGMLDSLGFEPSSNPDGVFHAKTIQPYMMSQGDPYNVGNIVEFQPPAGAPAKGFDVEKFMDICHAYSEAFDGGVLSGRNELAALHANAIIRACSKVGIIALVDEATGYQYARPDDALQFKLKLYLAEEMKEWEKTFPDELWRQFAKLTNFSGEVIKNRPRYWGKLVMDYIYRCLDEDVAKYIKDNKPQPQKGRNYHQWFNEDYGYKKLMEHINQVIGFAKACDTMEEFKKKMEHEYKGKPLQLDFFANAKPAKPADKPLKIDNPAGFDDTIGKIAKASK